MLDLRRHVDEYAMRARVVPAFIVALPVLVVGAALLPGGIAGWAGLSGLLAWCGAGFVMDQLGRDAGRRKQAALFEAWGGAPTTKKLRHREAVNTVTLARWHQKLKGLMQARKFPSAADEAVDPGAADAVYEAGVAVLREKTRDRRRFPLVFRENCSYGFRRNLWGMKPVGVTLAALALAVVAVLLVGYRASSNADTVRRLLIAGLVSGVVLVGWIVLVTPQWVAQAADAYAVRLLESIERL